MTSVRTPLCLARMGHVTKPRRLYASLAPQPCSSQALQALLQLIQPGLGLGGQVGRCPAKPHSNSQWGGRKRNPGAEVRREVSSPCNGVLGERGRWERWKNHSTNNGRKSRAKTLTPTSRIPRRNWAKGSWLLAGERQYLNLWLQAQPTAALNGDGEGREPSGRTHT